MKFPYKTVITAGCIIAAILGLYNLYILLNDSVKTQIATEGRLQIEVEADGYIIKNESVLFDSENQVVSSFVADGERVSKGALVATVYNTEVDSEVRLKLKNINEKIANLENLRANSNSVTVNDEYKLNSIAKSRVSDIINYAHRGEGYKLLEVRAELENVINSRIAADEENANTVLNKLKKEKEELESGIQGEKTPLYSDMSGLYFSRFDGFENVISVSDIESLTPEKLSDFEKLKKEKKQFEGAYAKICDAGSWYYAATVDTNKVAGIKKGRKVSLKLNEQSGVLLNTEVYFVSGDSDGKSVIVLRGDSYNEYIYYNGFAEADIVINTAEGIIVAKNAIKVVDNATGIYISKNNSYKFVEVEILASDDKNVIIKEPDDPNEYSLLYEEVVVKGEVK